MLDFKFRQLKVILLITLAILMTSSTVIASIAGSISLLEITNNMTINNLVVVDIRGDSVMAGWNGSSYVKNTSPIVMQNVLQSYYNNNSITVVNNAIQGTGTNSNMATWDTNIANSVGSVIMINFGINDMQGTPSNSAISITQYKTNLISMVNTVTKYNKIPILVTPNVITTFGIGSLDKATNIRLFAETMQEVAKELNVKLVDLNSYTEQYLRTGVNASVLFPDGLHGSETLYNTIGLFLADTFITSQQIKENDIIPAITGNVRYYGGANVTLATPAASREGYGIISNKIKIPIYVESTGLDIYIANPIWNFGTTSCNVKVDLNTLKTINNFDASYNAPYSYKVDNEVLVIKNATQGIHYIELDAQNNENTGFYYTRAYKTN